MNEDFFVASDNKMKRRLVGGFFEVERAREKSFKEIKSWRSNYLGQGLQLIL